MDCQVSHTLEDPAPESSESPAAIKIHRHASATIRCAVAETQGKRSSHEDAHSVRCTEHFADVWVLDGHRGGGAARFGASALAQELGQTRKGGKLPSDARVQQGFRTVDNQLRKYFKQNPAERKAGSTVIGSVVAKQNDGHFIAKLINCGDSRGIIIREPTPLDEEDEPNTILVETVDHKPNHPKEKARIKAAGGYVSAGKCPRIDGRLSVSRGLGDFEFKADRGHQAQEQKVSNVPDVYEVSGLRPGALLLLACDGLWSVLTSQVAAAVVRERLQNDPGADLGDIAFALCHLSLRLGSKDNVTVLLVQLGHDSQCLSAKGATVEMSERRNPSPPATIGSQVTRTRSPDAE
mmetsp:Transcript_79469/g.221144  ORF Transcript_79469/g.221144 Transcript_79469/m.221144 type:complete len:351 (-) Transcript_79469:7-1059(-)